MGTANRTVVMVRQPLVNTVGMKEMLASQSSDDVVVIEIGMAYGADIHGGICVVVNVRF